MLSHALSTRDILSSLRLKCANLLFVPPMSAASISASLMSLPRGLARPYIIISASRLLSRLRLPVCYPLAVSEAIISIIIPALDEEAGIEQTLRAVHGREGTEVIVVDGGSRDNTAEKAREIAHMVITAPRGRAAQMNAGAHEARGGILFFLHADCLPPEGFPDLIRSVLGRPHVAAGAFDIRIDRSGLPYRLIERAANIRTRLTGVPYGDQGLFISRNNFDALGGFREMPIMEDIEIGRRLKRMGRVGFLRQPMLVSARRWLRDGLIRTTLLDWALAIAYTLLRVSPEKLSGYYRNVR